MKRENCPRPWTIGPRYWSLGLAAGMICLLGLVSCQTTVPIPGVATPTPESMISVSGFIEATDVNIVPEVGAQIISLAAEEGDKVTAGQVVAQLDDTLARAQQAQAEAALVAVQAALTETLAGPRPESVAAAEADLARAQTEVIGARQAVTDTKAILYRPPGLAAQITQAETLVKLAGQEVERVEVALTDEGYVYNLTKGGTTDRAIEEQKRAALQADLSAAQAQLTGAQAYLAALQKVRQAPVDLIANVHAAESRVKVASATVTMTQASLAAARSTATPEEIAQAEANVHIAEANVALAQAQLTKFALTSPLSGVVTRKLAHAGEVSKPGLPILVVTDLSQLTLKVYIPETQIGWVAMGQPVKVSVDAYPGEVFSGTVSHIARQAEFTPSNVQTKDDRYKLVFVVKVSLPNADGRLKAGMPADAVFRAP